MPDGPRFSFQKPPSVFCLLSFVFCFLFFFRLPKILSKAHLNKSSELKCEISEKIAKTRKCFEHTKPTKFVLAVFSMKFRASRSKAYLHKSSERSAEIREKTAKTLTP